MPGCVCNNCSPSPDHVSCCFYIIMCQRQHALNTLFPTWRVIPCTATDTRQQKMMMKDKEHKHSEYDTSVTYFHDSSSCSHLTLPAQLAHSPSPGTQLIHKPPQSEQPIHHPSDQSFSIFLGSFFSLTPADNRFNMTTPTTRALMSNCPH